MGALGGKPTVHCDHVNVGVEAAAATADECNVTARFGSHAATAFVEPHWQHAATTDKIDGSLVSVAAA
jgi:hypothetical protein